MCVVLCVCLRWYSVVLAPDPLTAAADGLHHSYSERGSGEIAHYSMTSRAVTPLDFERDSSHAAILIIIRIPG